MIDPAVILAMLEPGPLSREEIAIKLSAPTDLVKHELLRLARDGQLKRTGGTQWYALPSYVAKVGRPAISGRRRRVTPKGQPRCSKCRRRPSRGYAGGLCKPCAQVIETAHTVSPVTAVRRRHYSDRVPPPGARRAVPRPAQPLTVVTSEGVEYQVVDYEALLQQQAKDWPRGGSSLTPAYFERPRLHSPRGARS